MVQQVCERRVLSVPRGVRTRPTNILGPSNAVCVSALRAPFGSRTSGSRRRFTWREVVVTWYSTLERRFRPRILEFGRRFRAREEAWGWRRRPRMAECADPEGDRGSLSWSESQTAENSGSENCGTWNGRRAAGARVRSARLSASPVGGLKRGGRVVEVVFGVRSLLARRWDAGRRLGGRLDPGGARV